VTIDYSGFGANLRLAEVPTGLLHINLRDQVDLFALGIDVGPGGNGSSVSQMGAVTLTDDLSAAASEVEDVAATDPTSNQITLTHARYALVRKFSDLFRATGGPGQYNEGLIADDAAAAIARTRSTLVTGLFSSAGANVGTSGADLTVTDIYSAIFELQDDLNEAPFDCVLHQAQVSDFQTSLRSEGGAAQFQAPTDDMLRAKSPGFLGSWHNVNFYSSAQVATANMGADRQGAMFARGAFGYSELDLSNIPGVAGVVQVPGAVRAIIEIDRTGTAATTAYTVHYYPAVALMEANRMVSITTDA